MSWGCSNAILELGFKGEVHVGKLTFGGIALPSGSYDAKNSPKFIKGSEVLKNYGILAEETIL